MNNKWLRQPIPQRQILLYIEALCVNAQFFIESRDRGIFPNMGKPNLARVFHGRALAGRTVRTEWMNTVTHFKILRREQVGTSSCCRKCSFVTRDLHSLIYKGNTQNCRLVFLLQSSAQSIRPVSLRLYSVDLSSFSPSLLLIFIGLDGPTAV